MAKTPPTNRRVLFVTTVFDEVQTGPGLYAHDLWRAFRDDPEVEFHVVAPRGACRQAGLAEPHPRLHAVDPADRSGRLYHRVARKARKLAAAFAPAPIVHGNAAHAMAGFVGYAGPWLAQVNDYEVATLWRHALGTLWRHGPARVASLAWRRRRERRVVRSATRVICNSDFTRRAVLSAYGPAESNVLTIHKAVDVSAFAPPADLPPDPLPDRARYGRLAFVGANWQIKGLDVLLKALARLWRLPGPVTLAVAGQDPSPTGARMRRLCRKLGLQRHVFFLGRLDRRQLAALLWHSDVFVLPSRQEAFGVSALEALAAGVPVVASNVGGLGEILRDGREAVLCPPGDPMALAEALVRVLVHPGFRRRLIQAGLKRADPFDLPHMIRAVRELYLSI